jgi:hypothetical protein
MSEVERMGARLGAAGRAAGPHPRAPAGDRAARILRGNARIAALHRNEPVERSDASPALILQVKSSRSPRSRRKKRASLSGLGAARALAVEASSGHPQRGLVYGEAVRKFWDAIPA